jgi:3-methyladenine DNA glycosylase/8-oxoguanine DNA glycosylase
MTDTSTLPHSGRYSLAASAVAARRSSFLDADASAAGAVDAVSTAVLMDDTWKPVALRLEQGEAGVAVTVLDDPTGVGTVRIHRQVRRMLSLDGDGVAFEEAGRRDPVLGAVQNSYPGLRPWLYASPYEALARAIIMHRLFRGQVANVMARLNLEHGQAVVIDGREVRTFPAPEALASLPDLPGLAERKIQQLRRLGQEAADGRFRAETLQALDPDEAVRRLRQVAGIGLFSAELVMIRGVGDPDFLPTTEPSLHHAMATAYDLGPEPGMAELEAIVARWSPFGSWAGLLFRRTQE